MRLPRDSRSLPEAFAAVAALCAERPEAEPARLVLELVVEELFTNLVRHDRGGGPWILLELEMADGAVRITLVDSEVDDFDPRAIAPLDPRTPLSARREGGLGVRLVHGFCDELTYDYRDRVVTVTAVKRL